jgi:hypothetical protein
MYPFSLFIHRLIEIQKEYTQSKKKKIKVRFNPVNTYIPPIKVQIIEIISWPKIGIRINPYFVKTRPRSNSI